MKHLSIILLIVPLLFVGCVRPVPPTLGPLASADFQKTRVIKVLDLLRDTAVDANAQIPPLITPGTTRKVVLAHQTALKVIQVSDQGWEAAVGVALAHVSQDPSLLPEEVQQLAPYFALAAQVLKGLHP